MNRHRKLLFLLPLLLALLLLGAWALREDFEAALVLSDIAAGERPSLLKRLTPSRGARACAFPAGARISGRPLPAGPKGPGRSAPDARRFRGGQGRPAAGRFCNETLARARFNVLVPDLASLQSLQVNSGNIGQVAGAFSWLASRADLSPGNRVGIIAFSYGAGPAILAALEPALRHRVRFIMAVGAYYDLRQVLAFFTTGWFRAGGSWRHRTPNAFGKWVFVLSNAERLPYPPDRRILRVMARRKLQNLTAGVADLAGELSPSGRAVYDFIVNTDRNLAPRLIANLPESIEREIRSLNLADKDLRPLRARLILVHGYDDDIIPYSQSIELARAVTPGQARLFLANGLAHVDLEPGLLDKWRLWRAVDALLAQRGP